MGLGRYLPKALRRWHTFQPMQWIRSTRRMRRMFAEAPPLPPANIAMPAFGVLLTPWLATTVPWYSLAIAEFLARGGSKVTLVFDDLPFGKHPWRSFFIRACIRSVVGSLAGRFPVIILDRRPFQSGPPLPSPRPSKVNSDKIDRLATLNAVHALRGETLTLGRASYEALVAQQLHRAAPLIEAVVEDRLFDAMFIPGGIYGTTGLWLDACRRHGTRVATHDSGGFGTLMLAADGIAAQLQDVPRAFGLLDASARSAAERAFAVRTALAELERRRAGKDAFASQLVASGGAGGADFDGALLMALNSSWDQAALGLHLVFRNNADWIVETVRWVLETTDRTIVVRQHPAERLEIARTTDDYRSLLAAEFGTHPRLRFIAAEEQINTYDLMASVAAVVVYSSTIGVEAAASGCPVIAASSSYYAGLGFIWNGTDRNAYFTLLRRALDGKLRTTPAMREDALCCYYLAQVCNWIFATFNPEGYDDWSQSTLDDLAGDEAVETIVRSLLEDIPAAYLNHLRRMQSDVGVPK